MKIYTRTGDDGSTGLLGKRRVLKSTPRVDAYGSVDELNAALGVARAFDAQGWLGEQLAALQARLFDLGAELAASGPAVLKKLDRIADQDVETLERWIDRLEDELPPLKNFVLPSGTVLAAQLHFARTVCRRAERRLVKLALDEKIEPRLVRYLNRLGDLLFMMARGANQRAGVAETEWQGKRS